MNSIMKRRKKQLLFCIVAWLVNVSLPIYAQVVKAFRQMLDKQGIKYVYYESPETAHEWLTWRRALYQYAQLLFR